MDNPSQTSTQAKRFFRSKSDRKLAGVCGGLAAYLNMDPTLVRILWVVLTIASFGVGVLAYLVFWMAAPEQ
ncbi:MAG TPA: PspC domain-containing protein [Candidatus Thermoplasmatota archaeon]|nr:PspC domain-containing protein [Candidatus Thermoplasmatota archaeon]